MNLLQNALTGSVQDWLSTHPLIYWVVSHPLYDLGLGLVALFMLAGLLKAIARLTEHLWVTVLQAPFRLGGWLLSACLRLGRARTTAPPTPSNPQERLGEILARLEMLRQEQDELLQEVRTILALEQKYLNSDR